MVGPWQAEQVPRVVRVDATLQRCRVPPPRPLRAYTVRIPASGAACSAAPARHYGNDEQRSNAEKDVVSCLDTPNETTNSSGAVFSPNSIAP